MGSSLTQAEGGTPLVNPLWLPRQEISEFYSVLDWVDLSLGTANKPGFRDGMKGVQQELTRALGAVDDSSQFKTAMEPVATAIADIVGGTGPGLDEARALQRLLDEQLTKLGFQIQRPQLGDMFDVKLHNGQAAAELGEEILVGGRTVKAEPGMITGVNGPTISMADGTLVRPAPVTAVPESGRAPQ